MNQHYVNKENVQTTLRREQGPAEVFCTSAGGSLGKEGATPPSRLVAQSSPEGERCSPGLSLAGFCLSLEFRLEGLLEAAVLPNICERRWIPFLLPSLLHSFPQPLSFSA